MGGKLKVGRLVHDQIKFGWSAYLRTQTRARVYLLGWIHAVVDVVVVVDDDVVVVVFIYFILCSQTKFQHLARNLRISVLLQFNWGGRISAG